MARPLWAVPHKSYSIGLHDHKGQLQAEPINNYNYILFVDPCVNLFFYSGL